MPTSIDELQIQIQGTASGANRSINALVKNLDNLQSRISKLDTSKFSNLSINTSKLSANTQKLSSSFNTLSSSAKKSTKSVTSLASAFGSLYANFFWVQRAFSGLMSSIESTSDYLEAYNFFDVSLTKIGKDWAGQWEQYGYENAESYAESFRTRLNEDLKKLSGVQIEINADGTGLLSETGLKNLGLNVQEVTQYMAQLASVTNSVGQTGETSLAISNAFTKLAGDISSLYNVDYSTASTNLQSGLIGQSRALYKYGIDITNATLQTKAYKLGLEKAVSEMTQAEKMQLRVLAILEQSKVAWGNLADTINQPANAMRVFKNQLSELSQLFGQLFIPIISKVIPLLSGITMAIKNLVSDIAEFFEIELEIAENSIGTSGLEDEIYGIEDATDSATESAKALKKQLQGFDKLNVITTTNTGETSGGVGSAGGIDLTEEILKKTKEYTNAWNEAFAKMEDRAGQFATVVEKALEDVKQLFKDISIGDWFAVGQDVTNIVVGINEFLTKAIANVDWQAVGNAIGLFLAGINWTEIFSSLGELFWEAINAAIDLYKGVFDVAPIETGILTAIGLLKFTPIGTIISQKIAQAIANTVGLTLANNAGITTALSGVGGLMANTLNAGFQAILGNKAALSALTFINPIIVKITGIGSVVVGVTMAFTNFFTMLKEGFSWFNEILMLVGIGLTAVGAVILGAPALVAGIVAGIVAVVSTLVIVIKDNWDSIVEWTSGLFENISNIFSAIKNNVLVPLVNYLQNRFGTTFEIVFNAIKGIINGMYQSFNGLINFITGVFAGDWQKAWNGIKDIFKGVFNGVISVLEGVINLIINGLNKFLGKFDGIVTDIGAVIGIDIKIPKIAKVSIPRYETGGFPEDGWFRASKGEYFGSFDDGTSVIANNNQIISGIANGVKDANAEQNALLREQNALLRQILAKDIGISTRDVFDAVRTENREYINRNGESAFAF